MFGGLQKLTQIFPEWWFNGDESHGRIREKKYFNKSIKCVTGQNTRHPEMYAMRASGLLTIY